MDDAFRAGMHAGDLRRIALELERSLPTRNLVTFRWPETLIPRRLERTFPR